MLVSNNKLEGKNIDVFQISVTTNSLVEGRVTHKTTLTL